MQFPFFFSFYSLAFSFLIFLGSFKRILCESASVSYSVGSEVWGSMDCTPSGFSVRGILRARVEWVAIPFSRTLTGIKHGSPELQADSLPYKPLGNPFQNSVKYGMFLEF